MELSQVNPWKSNEKKAVPFSKAAWNLTRFCLKPLSLPLFKNP
jgi:hypothetical protein